MSTIKHEALAFTKIPKVVPTRLQNQNFSLAKTLHPKVNRRMNGLLMDNDRRQLQMGKKCMRLHFRDQYIYLFIFKVL
jgi:hypothetical protein